MDKKLLQKKLHEIEVGIDSALEKGSDNEEVLEIMKEILEITKIKNKLSDYVDYK